MISASMVATSGSPFSQSLKCFRCAESVWMVVLAARAALNSKYPSIADDRFMV